MAKKILIIEDEPSLAKNLQLALELEYEVFVSNTGKDGLTMAQVKKPDLILLDIMLPDMDGIEILKKLKSDENTNDIAVVISTNLADKAVVSRILAAGGREYIVKTDWSLDDIVKKISTIIGK